MCNEDDKKVKGAEMDEKALVSIVIPVYNGSDYLSEAINSALAQTYENLEVIVVNDGSCDGGKTRKIAQSYGNKIRYYEKKNEGVSSALNLAIRVMKGKYFSWLSHDDIYFPDKIKVQMQELVKINNPELACYSDFAVLEMPGKIYRVNRRYFPRKYMECGYSAVLLGCISGCTMLIPKVLFDKYGLFDEQERAIQDYLMWFRLFQDKRILYVDQVLVGSRVHKKQVSATYTRMQNDEERLFEEVLDNADFNFLTKMNIDPYLLFGEAMFCRPDLAKRVQNLRKELLNMEEPCGGCEARKGLRSKILNKCSLMERDIPIYVYGFGNRGKALILCCCLRDLILDGVIDRDVYKQGSSYYGVSCMGLENVPKDAVILISPAQYGDIVKTLQEQGFGYFLLFDELETLFIETAINKTMLRMIGEL